MSFLKHERYVPTSVEWMGDIPDHWTLKTLRRLVVDTNAGEVIDKSYWGGDSELLYTCAIEPLPSDYGDFPDTKRTRPNDLLLTRNGTPYVHKPRVNSIYTNVVQRVTLNEELDRDFTATALQNAANNLRGYGVSIESLNYEMWKALPIAVPSPDEQKAISSFLDVETSKIDGLVSEQRRLIELLKEKRQAVISHAVTKGLNPNAPMKPSGIQWLGDVPQHWDVGPLKRFWSVTDCKHVTAEFVDDGGIPLASIREVQSKWVQLGEAKRTTQEFYELLIDGGREPQVGDLIFSRNATVGEVAQVGEDTAQFAMGQDVCLLRRLHDDSSSDYWQHVIKSTEVVEQMSVLMVGATFKRINVDEIRNLSVVSPPLEEQKEIAEFLDVKVERFDSLVAEAERAIELLQERRTALISAAVTGKIDVREFAN